MTTKKTAESERECGNCGGEEMTEDGHCTGVVHQYVTHSRVFTKFKPDTRTADTAPGHYPKLRKTIGRAMGLSIPVDPTHTIPVDEKTAANDPKMLTGVAESMLLDVKGEFKKWARWVEDYGDKMPPRYQKLMRYVRIGLRQFDRDAEAERRAEEGCLASATRRARTRSK